MIRQGFSPGKTTSAAAMVLALAALSIADSAVGAGVTHWLTGAGFQKQLTQPVDVLWSGKPLREALRGLSKSQRVAVLIDRRVDPGQELELQLGQVPLALALEAIAQSRGLGVSLLGPVAYFGPPRVTAQLRTIAALRTEEISRLPLIVGRKFLQPKRFAWDDFATPRELLTQLAEQNGLKLAGIDHVPHDLWAGADLPPLSLVDRLTLTAVQFDLTFQVSPDGQTVTLVPVPADAGLVRSYPGGRQPQRTAEQFAKIVPNARIKVVGKKVYVKGLLEEHQRLSTPPDPLQRPPTSGDQQRAKAIEKTRIDKMSVRDVPVGIILEKLAEQLKLDLRIDREALERAGISLEQRVSISVKDATVDELLLEVIKHTPLRFRRRGSVVEIGPAE